MAEFDEKLGKQLTKEEAIEIYESEVWKDWDDEEVVRFQLFQKKLCMEFSRFHEAVEKVLERPVFTHEFAYTDNLRKEYLGTEKPPTFEEIINLIPEEKRMIVVV